jgi:hypothetical protein
MARKHNEDEVLRTLRQKNDVRIVGNQILILNGKNPKFQKQNDLGNGSWGKIDFLKNHKGYFLRNVSEF